MKRHARLHYDVDACTLKCMADEDLNLLTALDALLAEGSVVAAAARLGLSASAMSRTLARLRAATGDQLLVRAGRGLVPTPHAEALRERVRGLAKEVRAVLQPGAAALDLASLQRTFTLRANEGFLDVYAARLVASVMAVAPDVRLRFAPKSNKDVRPLREGLIDIEIGVLGETGPEVRVQALFRDRFVGVVRRGHSLAAVKVTPETYAAFGHVVVSRRGRMDGPVDEALSRLGLTRRIVAVVPGFPAALAIVRASDLVGLVPQSFVTVGAEQEAGSKSAPICSFALPVVTPPITVSQMWHPRLDADPAHRWLRAAILNLCQGPSPVAVN